MHGRLHGEESLPGGPRFDESDYHRHYQMKLLSLLHPEKSLQLKFPLRAAHRGSSETLREGLYEQDLEQIRPQLHRYCNDKSLVKFLVLLVTPSLSCLLGPEVFLRHILPLLYEGRASGRGKPIETTIKCVSAVVDALPVPPETHANRDGNPTKVSSTEGLALFMSSTIPGGRSVHALSGVQGVDAENKSPATLQFCSAGGPASSAQALDQKAVVRHVTLPVANTIFVNGQRTTLFQDVWKIKLGESEEPAINYVGRKNLESFQLNLYCPPDNFVNDGSAPLQSLTKPRKVVRSMGNVLRQIEVEGVAVPASQELENAVSTYIKSNPASTARGPLLVFALIRPPGTSSLEAEAKGNNGSQESNSLKPLWQGAQLFKVSGGGGGWGKRQGLLSLEGAVDFETSEAASSSLVFPDLDSDQNIVHELGSRGIVPRGSTVEFLVCSADPASKDNSGASHLKPASSQSTNGGTTVVLGTATDPESQDCLQRDPSVADTGVIFLPDYFGMVSYGGAGLGVDDFHMSTRQNSTAISRTRCDVPNVRFILRGVGTHSQARSKEEE
ncbi:uncharacterized protein Z519_05995 [Cladophialophora bantiana CBS 173.52]|uniref:Uncharacterized protein n=1 Tax=Cladophialophora bantiana (strain ATCC 10958 / CBS 173.52 / CDC B-1940 / NIH 8579) TaxID=1442370 RepID=A0A0D2HRC3_CLAB1|nr:uncharacterized protein Z519_05995 [Cladophialophora bantiana CBS 173.52]KIW93390.1 hypothetical protein Z519_05995 [Cladophialophora bantiana CBS 173.52]